MARNIISPAGFTTSVLIADTVSTPGAGTDSIATTVDPNAALEVRSVSGLVLVPRIATATAPVAPANGSFYYDTTTTTFRFYQNGAYVNLAVGAGGVAGPGASTDRALASWNGGGGNLLRNNVVLLSAAGDLTAVHTIQNAVGTALLPSYTFTGNVNTGMWSSAANIVAFSADGALALEVTAASAASVNALEITANDTGTFASISSNLAAADANAGILLLTKGTGGVVFPVGAVATPSINFFADLTTGLSSPVAHQISFSSQGHESFRIAAGPAAAANFITMVPNAAGTAAQISAANSASADANVDVQILGKGTGGLIVPVGAVGTPSITFAGDRISGLYQLAANTINFATDGAEQFQIFNTAAATNILGITGSTDANSLTQSAPQIAAGGTAANTDVLVIPVGTGSLSVGMTSGASTTGSLKLWGTAGAPGFYSLIEASTHLAANSVYTLPFGQPTTAAAQAAVTYVTMTTTGTLANADITGMYAAPIVLLNAPPAGFAYMILSAYLEVVFAVAAPGAGGAISFQWGVTAHAAGTNVFTNADGTTIAAAFFTGAAANQYTMLTAGNIGTVVVAAGTGQAAAVSISNDTAAFTANGGTSTARYALTYMLVPMA